MRNIRVLSNHNRPLLAHQCTFREKIARFNIYQFYVIKINHRVQMIIDIAEFTPKELFSVIQPLSQCQNPTVYIIPQMHGQPLYNVHSSLLRMLFLFGWPPCQRSDMTLVEVSQHAYDYLYIRTIVLFVFLRNSCKPDMVLVYILLNKLCLSLSESESERTNCVRLYQELRKKKV